MNRCVNCVNFYQAEYQKEQGRGFCLSDKWAVNENYYTEYEGELKSDMPNVTYLPNVGKDFGCIHHETN